MTTTATHTPAMNTPQDTPVVNDRQKKLNQDRARDARVQRVRKIQAIAEACKDPKCEAFVSFGIMGVTYMLDPAKTQVLAASMLKASLDEHAADPGADPLPTDLEWVMEIVGASESKSPSMAVSEPAQSKSTGGTPVPPESLAPKPPKASKK